MLVDFWTYSCINCIRTLPHLRAWYAAYHRAGLEIVGVHTPEFAFEHVRGNVEQATHDLHVTWPVALDNGYKTWDAYSNEYWPAEYLIDRLGRVRRTHFGEGEYSEHRARDPPAAGGERRHGRAPRATSPTPRPRRSSRRRRTSATHGSTPSRYRGTPLAPRRPASYVLAKKPPRDTISFGGDWTVGDQRAVAGRDARLRLHFHAHDVYLVLGGTGSVRVSVDGRQTRTVARQR